MLLNSGSALNIPVALPLRTGVKVCVRECACVCVYSEHNAGVETIGVCRDPDCRCQPSRGSGRRRATCQTGGGARWGGGGRDGVRWVEWPFNEKMIRATAEAPEPHSGLGSESAERPRPGVAALSR